MASDQQVRTSQRSWAAECEAAETAETGKKAPLPPAYKFSNGRQFKPGQAFYDTKPASN